MNICSVSKNQCLYGMGGYPWNQWHGLNAPVVKITNDLFWIQNKKFIEKKCKTYYILYYKDKDEEFIHGNILEDKITLQNRIKEFGSLFHFRVKEVKVY